MRMRCYLRMPGYRFVCLALWWIAVAFMPVHAASKTQTASDQASSRRVALVIGNADYETLPLKNAVNDARQVGAALKKLGFDVTLKENADLRTMNEALRMFSRDAGVSQVRLFYYAGHGLQMYGGNYLVPIGSSVRTDADVPAKTTDVSSLIERVGNIKEGINIVILDTCRQAPLIEARDRRIVRSPGLAKTYVPQGTLIAFSTGPGGKATDGGVLAVNSVYTKHLLQLIDTPGLPVDKLFKQVRSAVIEETKGMQKPWDNVNMIGDFCFRSGPSGQCD